MSTCTIKPKKCDCPQLSFCRILSPCSQTKRRQAIQAKIDEHLAKLKQDAAEQPLDNDVMITSATPTHRRTLDDVIKREIHLKSEKLRAVEERLKRELDDVRAFRMIPPAVKAEQQAPEVKLEPDAGGEKQMIVAARAPVIDELLAVEAVRSVNVSFDLDPCDDTMTSEHKHDLATIAELASTSDAPNELKSDVASIKQEMDTSEADEIKMEVDHTSDQQKSASPLAKSPEVVALDDVKVDLHTSRSYLDSLVIDSTVIETLYRCEQRVDCLVDVSESLQRRDHYPRVAKVGYSRLDHLLERRQKQWKVEVQQKQILDAVLLRCRVQTIQKRRVAERQRAERERAERVRAVARSDQIVREKSQRGGSDSETDSDIEMSSAATPTVPGSLDGDAASRSLSQQSAGGAGGDDGGSVTSVSGRCTDVEAMDEMDMKDVGMGGAQIELSVMAQYACYSSTCRRRDVTSSHTCCYSALCAQLQQKAESAAREHDDNESMCSESAIREGISGCSQQSTVGNTRTTSATAVVNGSDDAPVLDPTTGELKLPAGVAKTSGDDEQVNVTDTAADDDVMDTAEESGKTEGVDEVAGDSSNSSIKQTGDSNSTNIAATSDVKSDSKVSSAPVSSAPVSSAPVSSAPAGDAKGDASQEKFSIQQQDGNTFIMHGERFKVIEQSDAELHAKAKVTATSYDALNLTNFTHAGKLALPPTAIPDLEVKSYMSGKTQYGFRLLRPSRGRGVTRSRLVIRKGCIPNVHSFRTQSGRTSILVLERFELRTLARNAGRREVNGFRYDTKTNNVLWPYPCARPRMKTCWRYRTRAAHNLSAVAQQLRILWASLRWDDLNMKAPHGGENTVTTEEEIRKKEIVERREVGAYGLRSQFLVREIVIPLNLAIEEPKRGQYLGRFNI